MPAYGHHAIRFYFEGVKGRLRELYGLPGIMSLKIALSRAGEEVDDLVKKPGLEHRALSMAS
jgi:hypothetical protein